MLKTSRSLSSCVFGNVEDRPLVNFSLAVTVTECLDELRFVDKDCFCSKSSQAAENDCIYSLRVLAELQVPV